MFVSIFRPERDNYPSVTDIMFQCVRRAISQRLAVWVPASCQSGCDASRRRGALHGLLDIFSLTLCTVYCDKTISSQRGEMNQSILSYSSLHNGFYGSLSFKFINWSQMFPPSNVTQIHKTADEREHPLPSYYSMDLVPPKYTNSLGNPPGCLVHCT